MNADELAFAGVAAQARMVRAREVSPRELVELYLERIERLEPRLNAFRVVMGEKALAQADALDGRGEGALRGVPIAVKDCHDVEGEVTTHGTGCFERPAAADSEMVRRLREAGAIVIGKTNLPELATSAFTETDTWGITRNPWNTDRSPDGSSGGSAVAIAAGLAAGATASDGAGSIRGPSAYCGLFGLKPQRGRVSLAPDPEHWHGLSVAGCVSRNVADTALWLDVTAGPADGDVDVAPPPDRPFAESAATPPGRLRIAVSVKPARPFAPPVVTDEVKGAVSAAAELLRSLGHEVDWVDPDFGRVGDQAAALYLRGIHEDFRKLPQPQRAMRCTRGLARLGSLYPGFVWKRAKRLRPKFAGRINRIFDDHDVLLTCVTGTHTHEIGRWEGQGGLRTVIGMSRTHPFNVVWNYTGNPAAAVPMGFAGDGMPLSVQLVGRPNDEATLLSLASQIEAERPWADRRPPVS